MVQYFDDIQGTVLCRSTLSLGFNAQIPGMSAPKQFLFHFLIQIMAIFGENSIPGACDFTVKHFKTLPEPHHEKTCFMSMRKTKTGINRSSHAMPSWFLA